MKTEMDTTKKTNPEMDLAFEEEIDTKVNQINNLRGINIEEPLDQPAETENCRKIKLNKN